jgi:hypothetical protein
MRRLSDIAIRECVRELRAACRLPIDEHALEEVVGWLRPNFERILAGPEGARRWSDHGHRMRDNARHLGAFADFFAHHNDSAQIGIEELTHAYHVLRADCTVRAERRPVAWEYCNAAPQADVKAAEDFLRAMAPSRNLVREPVPQAV